MAVCCCKDSAQLVKQPRILNGNDSLGGEVLYQLDLFVREWPDLLAHNVDQADQLIISQHRYTERSAESTKFNSVYDRWMMFEVGLQLSEVGDMDDLLCN